MEYLKELNEVQLMSNKPEMGSTYLEGAKLPHDKSLSGIDYKS
jgi:hypothetical protein